MAVLEKLGTRVRCHLLTRHLVGRSNLAPLRLREPNVSAEHAMICWSGREWEVHDLGSRNGTTLDDRRLGPGERVALARGATLGFGLSGNHWRLVDDGPPTAMAWVGVLEGNEPVCAEHELLVLPSGEQPDVTIYRDAVGDWVMERDGAVEPIAEGREVEAGGRRFALHLPDIVAPTWDAVKAPLRLDGIGLSFAVSRDEEHIELTVLGEGHRLALGARAHHALLLALARARLADEQETAHGAMAATLPETSHGWVYLEDLARDLTMDETHVNVAVFRCRQQLAAAGIAGAPGIVERRPRTRQLRLGVRRVEITTV